MPIMRPKIKIIDDDHKEMILEEAKSILENQGVFIEMQVQESVWKLVRRGAALQ